MHNKHSESAWRQGWRDTRTAWTSWQFLLVDILGGGLMGLLGEVLHNGWFWGLIWAISGLFFVWIGATARAPVKQRNEARKDLKELKDSTESIQRKENLIIDIAYIRGTGKDLLRRFKSIRDKADYGNLSLPLKEFRQWQSDSIGVLNNNNLTDDAILLIADINNGKPQESTMEDYIRTLTDGVNRLEKIADRLRLEGR
jgi:hypothetical protein